MEVGWKIIMKMVAVATEMGDTDEAGHAQDAHHDNHDDGDEQNGEITKASRNAS